MSHKTLYTNGKKEFHSVVASLAIDLHAILQKGLDRALSSFMFKQNIIRLSGAIASIIIERL